MIRAVSWSNAHLHGPAFASHHRLRYRVFIEGEGYSVPHCDGMEYDQFDTPGAVYLIWCDGRGEARGAARLLPTTRPYMIQSLWPELVGDAPPVSPRTWEATRFAVDPTLDDATRRRVAGEIVLGCLEFGLAAGIDEYLVVMARAVVRRTIGGLGCNVRFLGSSDHIGRYPVSAASVGVSAEALREARLRTGIASPILFSSEDQARAA